MEQGEHVVWGGRAANERHNTGCSYTSMKEKLCLVFKRSLPKRNDLLIGLCVF